MVLSCQLPVTKLAMATAWSCYATLHIWIMQIIKNWHNMTYNIVIVHFATATYLHAYAVSKTSGAKGFNFIVT
jgi:hypothetical protein